MKKLLKLSFVLSLFAMGQLFTSCDQKNEGIGDFSLSLKTVGADYVDVSVTAPSEVEMAYVVSTEAQLVTPAVLFATGNVITVKPGQIFRVDEDIQQDTHYFLYAVAKLDAANYSDRVTLEFDTKKYDFDELVTVVDTYYDGFKVHITVPEETKQRGHAIRTGAMPLARYYYLTGAKGSDEVDLQAIGSTGDPYSGHMFKDSTIVLNDANVVLMDENGEPVYDLETGEMMDIHDPMAPGEPMIFFAGETFYGTPDDFEAVMGYNQPTRDSWSVPYYDPEKGEWLGAFQKVEFFTRQPELCDATVEVDIPEDEISVTDAMIYFTMSEDAYSYFYMVLDNSTYNQILSSYLKGNEDWFQWFLTSYMCFYEWGVVPETENIAINAARNFIEPLTGGDTYHVLVTVFGDDRGKSQRFIHKTFKAKDKTKVPPVIEVTAVDLNDPYNVGFNIKAGADSKGVVQPIMGAYWVCNYAREFELMFNSGYEYSTLLKNLGWTFSAEEIAEINSEEGLTVYFPTLDGEVTRFAAYGCNDEYTFNVIDDDNTAAWADCKSPMAETAAPIASPLYEQLAGDWTATATLRAMQKEPDGNIVTYNVDHKSKITISASAPELPATLDPKVYDLYDEPKEEVDNMFAELGELSEMFTDYRLKGQNRLLCSGFMDFDPAAADNKVNRLEYRSPYDLFVATDYNSYDIAQLMYDFGPKWYLQVLEDGSVIVPFSTATMPPMHNWPGYSFYVGAVADGLAFYDASEQYPGFPVEISDDLNTITIKPIVIEQDYSTLKAGNYYMNAIGMAQGSLEVVATVLTDIVLKRGWTEPKKSAAASYVPAPVKVEPVSLDGSADVQMPKAAVCKSMSKFEAKPLPKYTFREKAAVVTKEMVDETSANILREFEEQQK